MLANSSYVLISSALDLPLRTTDNHINPVSCPQRFKRLQQALLGELVFGFSQASGPQT